MKPFFSSLFSAAALAAAGLLAAAPAHAVGRLMDVNVIDRDSGTRLPVYRYNGQWWVAGRPGARYAIQIRNATGARLLGVMSVDGVNVITGETASWEQSGYVLSRWRSTRILGWRKSNAEVAGFNFTALPNSYAARTGRPDNVGVIGVAVFREQPATPPPQPIAVEPLPQERLSRAAQAPTTAPPPMPEVQARAAAPQQDVERPMPDMQGMSGINGQQAVPAAPVARQRAAPADGDDNGVAEQRAAEHLGTGHGAREKSIITDTVFERLNAQPDEIITIRYDSCENLVALGVTVSCPGSAPKPFPESNSNRRFVPDPPGQPACGQYAQEGSCNVPTPAPSR